MADVDPAAAAARAVGGDQEDVDAGDAGGAERVADTHQDAEGQDVDADMGSTSRWREMLMSTDPDPRLEDVDNPWDPDLGGLSRVYRGLQKAFGVSGTPAVVDLAIGAVETFVDVRPTADDQEDQQRDREHDVDETDPVIG